MSSKIFALLLVASFLIFTNCTKKVPEAEKAKPTSSSASPFSPLAASKCEKALDAVPKYDESAAMFPKLFAFYKEYSGCLDAGIATAAQISTVDILNKKWSELKSFSDLVVQDPKFKDFVLNNINASVTGMTLEVSNIIVHAKSKCPAGLESLCGEIKARGERALAEDIEESEVLSNSAPPPTL